MIIQNNREELGKALQYVEEELKKYNLKSREATMTMLMAEESIVCMMSHTKEHENIEIVFKKLFGNISLNISARGETFDISEESILTGDMDFDGVSGDAEATIRNLIIRSQSDIFQYKNKLHQNTIRLIVKRSERMQLYLTLGAMLFSIILGIALKLLLSASAQNMLNEYLLTPVKVMFLNALKMIVGPVVFFSIVTCLSQFDSIQDLGKIGLKVMGMYLFTTLLAVLVGIGVFGLIQPGDASLSQYVTDAASKTIETAGSTSISLLDTVVNIVPSNIVKPFLEADMLQIIFIAIISGMAVGMIGDYSKSLKNLFEAFNMLFLKITTLIVKLIPLAVLCSMTSLVMLTGTETLLAIMSFFGTFILALAAMLMVYCALVFIITRLNPIILLKKHASAMMASFSLASSNAAMPFNMKSCQRLGISPRICSFSIPLGATVNMDGSCIYMAVAGLFLAKVFGIHMGGSELFSMIFSIIVLSIGAPGIPGAGLVCLSVLLTQIGVPAEALSLVMGIDSLLGMFRTAVNSAGDVAVSLIVAKSERLLDTEKYNS